MVNRRWWSSNIWRERQNTTSFKVTTFCCFIPFVSGDRWSMWKRTMDIMNTLDSMCQLEPSLISFGGSISLSPCYGLPRSCPPTQKRLNRKKLFLLLRFIEQRTLIPTLRRWNCSTSPYGSKWGYYFGNFWLIAVFILGSDNIYLITLRL